MKLHLTYLQLEFKRFAKAFPRLLSGAIVMAVLAVTIAFCGTQIFYKEASAIRFPIAIAAPENASNNYAIALDMLKQMESFKEMCDFIEVPDEESALRLLDDGEVLAAIILPHGLLTGIMNGTNPPISVYFPEQASAEITIIQDLAAAVGSMLSISQVGIYTLYDIGLSQNLSTEELDRTNQELNSIYLRYVLSREQLFQTQESQVTGELDLITYYVAAAISLLFLLSGICLVSFFQSHCGALDAKLRIFGMHNAYRIFCRMMVSFIGYTLFFAVLFGGLVIVSQLTDFIPTISMSAYIRLLPALFFSVCLQQFLYLLAANPVSGMLLNVLGPVLLLFLSGGFLPSAFLPAAVREVSPYLPGSFMIQTIGQVLNGLGSASQSLWLCAFAALFFLFSVCVTLFRKEESA